MLHVQGLLIRTNLQDTEKDYTQSMELLIKTDRDFHSQKRVVKRESLVSERCQLQDDDTKNSEDKAGVLLESRLVEHKCLNCAGMNHFMANCNAPFVDVARHLMTITSGIAHRLPYELSPRLNSS